ncbi:hypothetical protein JOF53_006533 [Crossiella equi]|uniref:Uncharacterized protein n=1 Tax=Crossiella equi TaxID=130796 RepID=A0ABS5AM73_9PSEU|nr:hypothetical protein [Crossiella equi]MBP2477661.1 hypothetical protein [Crossiella equi]
MTKNTRKTIHCKNCHHAWDEEYLLASGVSLVESHETGRLRPLNKLADDLLSEQPHTHSSGRVYPWSQNTSPINLAHTYWWTVDADSDDPAHIAAATLVNQAIFSGIKAGMGCLRCGFHH